MTSGIEQLLQALATGQLPGGPNTELRRDIFGPPSAPPSVAPFGKPNDSRLAGIGIGAMDPRIQAPIRARRAAEKKQAAATKKDNDEERIAQARAFQTLPQLRESFFGTQGPNAALLGTLQTPAFQAAQVRAPNMPRLPTEAEVAQGARNIAGGDVRAQAASQMGGQYMTPDFLQRPEGEEQIEDFAFRRMVALGDKAPAALTQTWAGIQQAKQQRLMARADFHANLIKQRHGFDLDLRNQSFTQHGQNRRLAAEQLMGLRMKQAEMEMTARMQNARAANQLKGDQRQVLSAFAASGAQKMPTVEERTKIQEKFVKPAAASYEAALQAKKLYTAVSSIDQRLGGGFASRGLQWFLNNVGEEGASEFRLAWAQLKNTIVKNFSSEAGARAIDTPVELRALADTMPNAGDNPDAVARWVDEWVKKSNRALGRSLNGINDMFPGYGDQIMEDLTGGSVKAARTSDIWRSMVGSAP